jgi:hypothetical protein
MKNKIKNMLIILLVMMLLITTMTYAYTVNIDFWRDSRLEDSHDGGYEYIPSASQFIEDGCGTGTVLDKEHGLCWDGNGNRFGLSNWSQAHIDCDGLTLAGKTWRLPTINELLTLVKEEGTNSGTHLNNLNVGFSSYQDSWYWTGDVNAPLTSHAWYVNLNVGIVNYYYVVTYVSRVVCVSRY